VASGELLERALALAGRFSQLAPLATAQTRAALARGLDQVLDWERDTQAALLQTADHAEGRTAFLERRKPNFTGR
jgi:2-(1,2-epoxy-1,2-dihydrophenyl)acetyl-CoA isomerase